MRERDNCILPETGDEKAGRGTGRGSLTFRQTDIRMKRSQTKCPGDEVVEVLKIC